MGDFHSGGLTALFPGYNMTFKLDDKNSLPYQPSALQKSMYKHFMASAKKAKEAKDKQKVIVINGDAIDGNHHGTAQLVTPNPKHHVEIHIELMENFLEACEFSVKNGDQLHYVSGTESHVGWEEYSIVNHFESYGAKYHDELRLTVNGRRLWWTHQGAKPGKGANEGNAVRNFARDLYFDCLKESQLAPHLISMSHFHKYNYDSFNDSHRHTIHAQVLPSWQAKTRFGLRASPFQRNDIGLIFNEVTAEGDIRFPAPFLWKEK